MKKILIFTLILVLSSIPVWAGERVMKFPSGTPVSVLSSTDISDDAYGTGWNGETTTAPSQNAVYDKIEAIYGGAEVNNLETVCTDIADTEILIGYAADSGSYYPLSGEVTMSNSGVVALADSVAVSSWNLTTPTITTSLTTDSKTISEAEIGILDGGIEGTEVLSTGEGGGSKYLREDGDGTCSWQAVAGSGSVTTMKEATVQVGGADIVSLDFGAGFDLTEDPDTEVNFTLDLSEIAAGGELGGNMDAPTIDDSIGVSSWTLTTSTLMDTALCYTDNDTPATAFILGLRKARDGDPTDDVSAQDYLGYIRYEGYHTDGYDESAVIRAVVDNTPGNGDMPGRLEFLTTPDASATPAVRMTIKSTGYVGISTTDPSTALQVAGTVTATAFSGALTGNVTGDCSGNAGTATTAGVATTVTITDNEDTAENNPIVFVAGGDLDGGDLGLESDGTCYYTPSTGKITTTGFVGALTGNADTVTNGVYTTDAGSVFLAPNGDGSGLSGVVTSEVDPSVDSSGEILAIIGADGIIDTYIDDDGNFAFTGTWDFGGGNLEVENAAGDVTLTVAGEVGVDTTQKQFVVFDGIEKVIPLLHSMQGQLGTGDWDSDPDVLVRRLLTSVYPDGIVITGWTVTCNEADPTTELNANIYYCDDRGAGAFPGANPVLVDVIDTTTGNAAVTDMSGSDLGSGVIPAGKELYIIIDADLVSDTTLFSVDIDFYIPED